MSGDCPINFNDCPDCEHYSEGECQFKDEYLIDGLCPACGTPTNDNELCESCSEANK